MIEIVSADDWLILIVACNVTPDSGGALNILAIPEFNRVSWLLSIRVDVVGVIAKVLVAWGRVHAEQHREAFRSAPLDKTIKILAPVIFQLVVRPE